MKIRLQALVALSALLISATSSSAQILTGASFGSQPISNTGVLGETFVGVDPSTGSATLGNNVTLVQSVGGFYGDTQQPALTPFINYYYRDGAGTTFTFGGLTAGTAYNVVAYNAKYAIDVTIGLTTGTILGDGPNTSFVPSGQDGSNYFEGTAIANLNGDLSIFVQGTRPDNSLYTVLSGLGISEIAAQVPEPSTYALFGLAGLAFVLVARRHRNFSSME